MNSSYLDKKIKFLFFILFGFLFGFLGIENSKILVEHTVYAASDEVTEIDVGEDQVEKIIAAPGIFTGSLGIITGNCELLIEQAKKQRKEIAENNPKSDETVSDIMPDTVNNGRMNRAISGFAEGLVNGLIDTEDINQENPDDMTDKGILGINCNGFGAINWFTKIFEPVNITNVPVIMNIVNTSQILAFGVGMVLLCMYGIYYTLGKHEIDPMKFIMRAFIVYMVIYYLPYFAQDILNLNNVFIYYLSTEEFAIQAEDNGQVILQMGSSGIGIAIFAAFSQTMISLASAAIGTGMASPFSMFIYALMVIVISFFVKVIVQLTVWWYMRLIMIYFLIAVGPIFMIFMILPNTAGYASQWIKYFVAEVFTQGGMVLAAFFMVGILRSPAEIIGGWNAFLFGNMILTYAAFSFLNKVPNLVKGLLGGMNGVGWDDAGKVANQMSALTQAMGQYGFNKYLKNKADKKDALDKKNKEEQLNKNADKVIGDAVAEQQKNLDKKRDEKFKDDLNKNLNNQEQSQMDQLSKNKEFKDSLNDLKKKLADIDGDSSLSAKEKQTKKDEAIKDFTDKLTNMGKDMNMMEGNNEAKLKGQMRNLADKIAEQMEQDMAAEKIKNAGDKDAKKKQKLNQAIDNLNESFDEAKQQEMDDALDKLLPGFKDLSEEEKDKVRKAATKAKEEQDKQKQAENKLNEAKKSLQDEFKKNDIDLNNDELNEVAQAMLDKEEAQKQRDKALAEKDGAIKNNDQEALKKADDKLKEANQKIEDANKKLENLLGDKVKSGGVQDLMDSINKDLKDKAQEKSIKDALDKQNAHLSDKEEEELNEAFKERREAKDASDDAKKRKIKAAMDNDHSGYLQAQKDEKEAQEKLNKANEKIENMLENKLGNQETKDMMDKLNNANNQSKDDFKKALESKGLNNLTDSQINTLDGALKEKTEGQQELNAAKQELDSAIRFGDTNAQNNAQQKMDLAQQKIDNANKKIDGIIGDQQLNTDKSQNLLNDLASGKHSLNEALNKNGVDLNKNDLNTVHDNLNTVNEAMNDLENAKNTLSNELSKPESEQNGRVINRAKKDMDDAQKKLDKANQNIDGILRDKLNPEQRQELLDNLNSGGVPTASEIKDAFGKEGLNISDSKAQELSNSLQQREDASKAEANAQATINAIEGKGIENASNQDIAKLSQAKKDLSAATQQRQNAENAVNNLLQDSARNNVLEGIQPIGNGAIDTKEAMGQFLQDNNVNLDTNQKEQLHNAYQSKQQAQESKKVAQATLAAESQKDSPNQSIIDKANEDIAKADKTIQNASKTMEGIVSEGIKSQAIEGFMNDVEKGAASISQEALQTELASKGINLDETAANALFSANQKKEKAEAKREQAQNKLREIAETGNPDNPDDVKVAQEARQEIKDANQEIMSAEKSMEAILGDTVVPVAVNEALKSIEQGMSQVSKANQELQSAQINAKAAELNYNNVAQNATGNKPIGSASDFIKQLENATQVANVSLGNDLVSNLAEQIINDNLTQEEAVSQLSDHLRTEQGLTGDTDRLARNMINGFENRTNNLQDVVQRNIDTGVGKAESIKQAENSMNELANNASKIANAAIGDSRKESAIQNAINTLKESGTEAAFDALIDGYTTTGIEPAEAVEQAKNDMKVIEQSVKQAANGIAQGINVDNKNVGSIGQAISNHGSLGSAIADAFISGGANGKDTLAGFHQQQHAESLAKNELVDMKANQFAKKQTSDFINNATTKVLDGLNLGENNSFFTEGNLGFANSVLETAQSSGIEAAKSQMIDSYMKQGMSENRATSMANNNIGHVETAMDNIKRAQDVMESYQNGGRDEAFKTLTQSFKDSGMSNTNATIKAHENMQHVENAIQSAAIDTVMETANTIGFNTVNGSEVSQQIADNFGNQTEMEKTVASFVGNPTVAAQTTQQIMDNATQKISNSFSSPETQFSSDNNVNNQAISAVTNAFATGGRDNAISEMVSQLTANGVSNDEAQTRAEAGVSFIESAIADSTNEALTELHDSGRIYDVDKVSSDMLSSFGGVNPVGVQTTLSNSIKGQIQGANSSDFNTGMVSSYGYNNKANNEKINGLISHAQSLASIEANAGGSWSGLNDSLKNDIIGYYGSGERDRDFVVGEIANSLGGSEADLERADNIIRELEEATGIGWNANKEIYNAHKTGRLNEDMLGSILTDDATRRAGISAKHDPEGVRQHIKNAINKNNYSSLGVTERSYRERVNEERKASGFQMKIDGHNHKIGVEQLDTRNDSKYKSLSLSAGKLPKKDDDDKKK